MKIWFSADLHLGHSSILEFCNRPFKDGDDMNAKLIHNWNQRIKPEDTVYHLGDYCFHRGIQGSKTKSQQWEEQMNGKIIHIKGNHDSSNNVKSILTHAVLEFGGYTVLAQHIPPTMCLEVPEFIDFVLCGHLHNTWKHMFLEDTRNEKIPIPIINVGVDVWNFKPVSMQEIIVYYERIVRERNAI